MVLAMALRVAVLSSTPADAGASSECLRCAAGQNCSTTLQSAVDVATAPGGSGALCIDGTWPVVPTLLRSNLILQLTANASIIAQRGAFHGGADHLITVSGARNVSILGAVGGGSRLVMRKSDYTDTKMYSHSEDRHALYIVESQHVRVSDLEILDPGGDSVYLGGSVGGGPATDVELLRVVSRNAYRNGLSITGARDVVVRSCSFLNTSGTPPEAGIDIEPNDPNNWIHNITFLDLQSRWNRGSGLSLALGKLSCEKVKRPCHHPAECVCPKDPPSVTITIAGAQIQGASEIDIKNVSNLIQGLDYNIGIFIAASPFANTSKGWFNFSNVSVNETVQPGLEFEDKAALSLPVRFENCSWSHVATAKTVRWGGQNVPLLLHQASNAAIGGIDFDHCSVNDGGMKRPWLKCDSCGSRGPALGIAGDVTVANSKGCKTKGVPTDNLVTTCDRNPSKSLALKTDDARVIDHMDASLPVDTRVAALLAKMTNAEKAAQTILFTAWVDNASAYKAAIELYNSTGVGALSGEGCGDAQCTRLAYQNAAQAMIINSSRLHIPASFICETLHSADGISTIFPMPCLQGATWNTELVHDVAASIARQARAGGVDRGFSPEINVCTDPRFGRSEENFGEDPALVSAMGVAAVTGLHGDNMEGASSYLPTGAIVSEAKHAAAYGFAGRDGGPADLSQRTLHDVYFRPWREYVAAGGRGAMMSHNSINDIPAHANAELMDFMRNAGGDASVGMLIASDECDVANLMNTVDKGRVRGFGIAANLSHAGALSMTAGLDQEFCYNGVNADLSAFLGINKLVDSGQISQSVLDRAASNVLRAKFAAGLFENPYVDINASIGTFDTVEDRELARRVAVEGAVLLKNGDSSVGARKAPPLPLKLTANSTVAIIGPLAGDSSAHNGNYAFSSAHITTVLEAAAVALPDGTKILHTMGCNATGNYTTGFAEALAVATAADVVITVVGDSGDSGWATSTCGEDDDRYQLELPGMQSDLLTAISEKIAGTKPIVAVLIHGRPVTFVKHDLLTSLDAVLAMFRPGEEGGPAAWDLLLGKQSPSGRLAQAWPRSAGQVHSSASPWFHKRQGGFDREPWRGGPSKQNVKSQNYSAAPMYDFQYGLSYTTFNISVKGTTALNITPSGSVNISVTVRNTGTAFPAKAVVAVYFSKPVSNRVRYHRMLASFVKTPVINASQAVEVVLEVPAVKLASYDPMLKKQSIEPGEYNLYVVCDDSTAPAVGVTVSDGDDWQ